ncbi:hypothetical protein GCM10009609_48500 [Pseudonocardia aurantiaca]
MSLQERVVGVVALAVPVYDHTGSVAAALSISIPAARAGLAELEALAPVAIEAAKTLSYRLGYGLRSPDARPSRIPEKRGPLVNADASARPGSAAP